MKDALLLSILTDQMMPGNEEPGLLYILSYIRAKGYTAEIRVYKQSAINFEEIQRINPAVIGITTYTMNLDAVLTFSSLLKEKMPQMTLCLGGNGVEGDPVKLLDSNKAVDFLILGEGESAFEQLLKAFINKDGKLSEIPGLVYRMNGAAVMNDRNDKPISLRTIPWMARDLLRDNQYEIALISGSRGCTGRCSFCVTGNIKKRWRGRTPADIVEEIQHVKNTYGIHVFYFIDCSFENPGESYDRVDEIVSLMIDANTDVHYQAFFRSDFHRMATSEIMSKLKRSGLYCTILGVESANKDGLKLYNKSASVLDHQRCIDLFRANDICVELGFIMFQPYTTIECLRDNIRFLYKNNMAFYFDYIGSRFSQYPNCSLTEKIFRDGLCYEKNNLHGYHFVHPEIQVLYDYLTAMFNRYSRNYGLNLTHIHTSYISYEYKKRIHADDYNYLSVLNKYPPISAKNFLALNESSYRWFESLLDLLESGWQEKEADRITIQYLPDTFMLEIMNTIKKSSFSIKKYIFKT